jgi:hypothetical protein
MVVMASGLARYGLLCFSWHIFSEFGAAVQAQWPQITADLDHATPAALGLVTAASAKPSDLGLNHQVLACAYDASET